MSKYSDEFIAKYKTVGRVKQLTKQMKKTNKKEVEEIEDMMKRFKPRVKGG